MAAELACRVEGRGGGALAMPGEMLEARRDTALEAARLEQARSASVAVDAGGVGIVDDQQGAVALAELFELREAKKLRFRPEAGSRRPTR